MLVLVQDTESLGKNRDFWLVVPSDRLTASDEKTTRVLIAFTPVLFSIYIVSLTTDLSSWDDTDICSEGNGVLGL